MNILADDQLELCKAFASKGGDKFSDVAHRLSPHGMPILDDVVAFIECTFENEIDAGDHTIALGRVVHLQTERDATPLLFFKGKYGRLAELA